MLPSRDMPACCVCRPLAAGPSAPSEAPNSANTAGARTAAATDAHIAAQVPAVAAPAEVMPAAANPTRPRVSKRKAPSEEARPATQPEPNVLPSTPQAGSGLGLPARQEQQASRRGSARAAGPQRVVPARSKQATGRGLHSSGSKARAPVPGIRGTTTDDDCIDLSKLTTPVSRSPQALASHLAANDVVIDLT